ncbi:MAG: permease prefix domain 1-containing protein, partial [Opitutaceae bacterium]
MKRCAERGGLNMQELETQIVAWRARLNAGLSHQEETVRELEAHLRDHIEVQMRRGVSATDAFAAAVKRIGEPRRIAREFARTGASPTWFGIWRPAVAIYLLTIAGYAAGFISVAQDYAQGRVNLLLATHAVTLLAGYFALLAAGLVGGATLMTGWSRALTERERQAQRRELFRLTLTASVASVVTPVGIML